MSNRLTLEATEFKNPTTNKSTYGYRLYDDYDATYCNLLDECITDDLQLLRYALTMDDSGSLDFIRETERGMCINDTWYDWEEIKDILTEPKKP